VSADRNLLFGILAVQMDFVCKDDLIAAMYAWVLAKHRPLADLLADRGCLRPDHRALLEALVQAQLDRHGGDARQSLAARSPLGSVSAEPLLTPTAGRFEAAEATGRRTFGLVERLAATSRLIFGFHHIIIVHFYHCTPLRRPNE
jgi:hypothetical protein